MLAGLAILLVLLLLSFSVLLLSIKRKQTATYRMNQTKALSLAEVGVTQALLDLERAADIDDNNDGTLDTAPAAGDDDGDSIDNTTDPDIDGDGIPSPPNTTDSNDGNIGSTALGIGSYSVSTTDTTPVPFDGSVAYYTITSTGNSNSSIISKEI